MRQVQLYTHIDDYGSFSNIGRAVGRELHRHRIDAAVHPLGRDTLDPPLPCLLNFHAPIGIAIGYPTAVANLLQSHRAKILMTVCETDRIPADWVTACRDVDYVCVPSDWCVEVFARAGVPRDKLIKVQHGVPSNELLAAKKPEWVPPGTRLLHVSGADSFPQRKGTSAAVYAVKCLQDEGTDVQLWLRVRDTAFAKISRALGEPSWLRWVPPINTTVGWWSMMLGFGAVLQPSRAEGFGMVPLEAMCLGIPTITTPCGGHLEHTGQRYLGNVFVELGPNVPMRSQGNDVGYAPMVSVDAVYMAIHKFLQHRDKLTAATSRFRRDLAAHWDWHLRLLPLMEVVKRHETRGSIVLGADAGLRGVE